MTIKSSDMMRVMGDGTDIIITLKKADQSRLRFKNGRVPLPLTRSRLEGFQVQIMGVCALLKYELGHALEAHEIEMLMSLGIDANSAPACPPS